MEYHLKHLNSLDFLWTKTMFYSQDAFIGYSDAVLEALPVGFSSGDYGLTVGDLKHLPGLGSSCLVNLASVLGISDDVVVLKFVLNDYEIQYCVPPAFRKGKTQEKNALFFTMGDYKIEVAELFTLLKKFNTANGYGKLALKRIVIGAGTPQEKIIAGFKFDLTKPTSDDDISQSVEYEFAIAPNRKMEDAQAQLVKFLDSGKKVPEIIIDIIASEATGKVYSGGTFTVPLKTLPVGVYEVRNIDRLDKVINKKDGSQGFIKGWTFEAIDINTGVEYSVDCNDGCFIDKKISGTGFASSLRKSDSALMSTIREALDKEANGKTDEQVMKILLDTPQILKQAGVGCNGYVMMIISEQKVISSGISPQGDIMTNVDKGKAIFSSRFKKILELEASKQKNAELPPATTTVDVNLLEPAF